MKDTVEEASQREDSFVLLDEGKKISPHDMKLHQVCLLDSPSYQYRGHKFGITGLFGHVVRVPGGWIYVFEKSNNIDEDFPDSPYNMNTVFVPFNDEFQKK